MEYRDHQKKVLENNPELINDPLFTQGLMYEKDPDMLGPSICGCGRIKRMPSEYPITLLGTVHRDDAPCYQENDEPQDVKILKELNK